MLDIEKEIFRLFLWVSDFSSKLGVGFNLLGMDLFDRYRVVFDNIAKKIIFEPYES